jgi:membrane protein YqaA with SNARE-associated domain
MAACETVLTALFSWMCPYIATLAYPMALLVNLIGSASIFLPLPGFAFVFFLAGMGFDPWLLGIFGGLGAAIGEFTGYAIGFGGRKLAESRKKKGLLHARKKGWLEKAREWSRKRGVFFVLFLFAATPLPDDITGIIAGAIGYSMKKFFIAVLLGKLVMFTALAWGGHFGAEWALNALGWGI